ncbi:hypothetical protein [Aquiflexum sp.]|uniref:hypothetical protein n=1 Tax=Aquiflexum sp. TaxID=1872584 RepID=UPI003593C5B0
MSIRLNGGLDIWILGYWDIKILGYWDIGILIERSTCPDYRDEADFTQVIKSVKISKISVISVLIKTN